LGNCPRLCRDQIPNTIRRIIAPNAIIIHVHFQNILRPVRIVLQRRQAFHEPSATLVNEKARANSVGRIANHLPADQKEIMALVNGFSILCSAAREMLLNVTARSAYGPVSLPTLSFVSLVREARKQKAESQKATTPAVPA